MDAKTKNDYRDSLDEIMDSIKARKGEQYAKICGTLFMLAQASCAATLYEDKGLLKILAFSTADAFENFAELLGITPHALTDDVDLLMKRFIEVNARENAKGSSE